MPTEIAIIAIAFRASRIDVSPIIEQFVMPVIILRAQSSEVVSHLVQREVHLRILAQYVQKVLSVLGVHEILDRVMPSV